MSWELPKSAVIAGKPYDLHTDFRDILEIIGYLNGDLPEFIRWQVALALFYVQPVEEAAAGEAMRYLAWFLSGGEEEPQRPGPKLFDWEHDAAAIVSDVNLVAGQEIRAMAYLHWWTFLSWFHGIGQGQMAALVALRSKLQKGQKLTEQEREFYRQNKTRVDLPKRRSPEEEAERQRLQALLG